MEIPYTVTARPDTGLWNAKIGIWLFLASEVMLFGGLFSSYIFLRVGADYPWPVGVQKVPLGFTNTLVLILSSVTVVFAWASLKMRKYNHFRIYMAITLLCAFGFMGIKAVEYSGKWTHWSLQMHDGSVITGHVSDDDDHNYVFSDVRSLKLDTTKSKLSYFTDFITTEDWKSIAVKDVGDGPVTLGDTEKLERYMEEQNEAGVGILTLNLAEPIRFSMSRRIPTNYTVGEGDANSSVLFRDGTTAEGKLENNGVTLEVDALDLQAVKLDKVEDGKLENARVFHYLGDEIRKEFTAHREKVNAEYREHHGAEFPVDTDIDVRRSALQLSLLELSDKIVLPEGTHSHPTAETGGEKGDAEGGHHHGHVAVPVSDEDIKFYSNFSPRLNTYYAIYFLLTGLHGLHVLGGIIVLGYFFLFGKKLYDKDPEHMANRVEVGGLFWHFVDLVWIFLFPILYLM